MAVIVKTDGYEPVTISSGSHTSEFRDFEGATPKAIFVPSTSPASAIGSYVVLHRSITATGPSGPTYDSDGSVIKMPIVAGAWVELAPDLFKGMRGYRLQTLDSDGVTAKTQTQDRVFYVATI